MKHCGSMSRGECAMEGGATSLLTDLPREDARRLRAMAWRHLRRLDGPRARIAWRAARRRSEA